MTISKVLFYSLVAILPRVGRASALQTCQKTHESSVKECKAAKEGAKVESGQAVSQARASTGENGGTPNLGGALAGAANATTVAGMKAKATCEQKKDKCDSDCNPSKGKDAQEKSKITQEKEKCAKEIKEVTDALDGSAAETTDGKGKAEETKKEASGNGAPTSMPSGGDSKKDDAKAETTTPAATPSPAPTPEPAPAPTAANAGSGKFSDDCTGDKANSEACKSAASAGSGKCPGDLSMTVCKLSQSFCAGADTDQCASCRKLKGLGASSSVTQTKCSLDPIAPSDTAGAQAFTTNSLSSGASSGASGGGGGGGMGTSLGSSTDNVPGNGKSKTGAAPESAEAKTLQGMNTQSAGGGGGGGGGPGGGGEGSTESSHEVSDFLAGYGIIGGRKLAATKTSAGADAGLNPRVTDVAPSPTATVAAVFQIQSLVIQARCDADKELNCPPRK